MAITSLLGCGVTMTELHALNPRAATLKVHCHPWQILDNVKIFAVRPSGDDIVTDETPRELREYAEHAGAFIEVDASAPHENARTMADEYGLVCRQDMALRSTPLDSIRPKEPCSIADNAPVNRQFVGDTNSPPCAEPAEATAPAKIPPKRIPVCVKPSWIKADLKEWAIFKSNDKHGTTPDRATFEANTMEAEIIFVLDPAAPPETAYYFTKDANKLSCPQKPAKTFDQIVKDGAMPDLVDLNAANKAMEEKASRKATTTTTTTAKTPKAGSSPPSSTSSPNGQGPALSVFEQIVNNVAVGGALAQGNTSGSLNDPNGHRNGIPGGKNVGGFSFPLLQAGVAAYQIINAVGLKPKDFIDLIHKASKKGQRTVIEKADKAALDLADDLIKNHGQYPMAQGLQEMQTIMPYSMAEKFTKDLGNAFQAHKIFERRALDKLKQSDAGFEKLPAVILTKEEHQEITNLLNVAWKEYAPNAKTVTAEQLRKIYKKAYEGYPHWLKIIEQQLR